LRLGTTAFSFTNEWLARQLTLDQLLARVAELNLGPGIELIGFQAWRGYPRLSPREVLAFCRMLDDLGLEPAALGGYVDVARRVDRPMTTQEAIEFLRPQIECAQALGFPLIRLHNGIPVVVLETLLPEAERAGVTLAIEVQGAQTPDDPAVAAVLASPSLALVLDFSVAMTRVPNRFRDAVCRLGMSRDDLDEVVALWEQGADVRRLFTQIHGIDAPAAALDEARAGFVRFGRQEPRSWLPLVSRIAYAHAKFWELDADGEEATVRNAELFGVLEAGGFEGVVSSEWGGSAWADADDVDAFRLVRRHQTHCRALISMPAAQVPA
jgi:hypothetical protein